MVEDEFQAVAQAFTRQLHHTEYVRLGMKVRTQSSSGRVQHRHVRLRDTGAKTKIEVRELRQKQLDALESLLPHSMTTTSGISTRDEEGRGQLRRGDELWAGTALERLMLSHEPQKPSLLGLERVPSTTRAARGFSARLDNSPKAKKMTGESILDLVKTGATTAHRHPARPPQGSALGSLGGSSRARANKSRGPTVPLSMNAALRDNNISQLANPSTRTASEVSKQDQDKKRAKSNPRNVVADFSDYSEDDDDGDDGGDESCFGPNRALPQAPAKLGAAARVDWTSRPRQLKPRANTRNSNRDGKSRLDEVPTFFLG